MATSLLNLKFSYSVKRAMAISVPKKKQKQSKKTNALCFFCSFLANIFIRLPAAVFLLALVYLWCTSTTVLSSNVVHVCVSSRKLSNLYCLSAGTQPSFHIPVELNTTITSSEENSILSVDGEPGEITKDAADFNGQGSILAVNENSQNETLTEAFAQIEDQLRIQRSWISDSTHTTCEGRGIFVYDLPSKFNKDLLSQCGHMIPWLDFCKFMSNGALGEPIEKLGSGWYSTHQYSLEPIFHARIMKHPCRVYNQDQAKLFYVPYYGGLDILRWHFKNASNYVKDSLALELVRWLESQGPWYRNMGKDHVLVLGKISWDFRRKEGYSWGTNLLEIEKMQNPIKLLIERQPWHQNDVGIPHPTFFHPKTDDDIVSWQLKIMKSNRKNLASFAGADRPDSTDTIRSTLIRQCTSTTNEECKFLNCTSGKCNQPESIINLFTESEFCLQPPGDSPTRKSVFDSLVSGCIPVLFDPFTVYYQYPWHFPADGEKYSVFVDKEDVKNKGVNVVERLRKIPVKERENMRRYIVFELLPGLVYGDFDSKFDKFQDAFSITVNNLLERVGRLSDDRI